MKRHPRREKAREQCTLLLLREYLEIKQMMYKDPKLLHHILGSLAGSIGDYANYQIESGAQVIQVFDSWAGHLSPLDYDTFAAPYQKQVIDTIKKAHPEVPVIIYINKVNMTTYATTTKMIYYMCAECAPACCIHDTAQISA
eukprot:12727-Heterococcus_DN1.PRE.2